MRLRAMLSAGAVLWAGVLAAAEETVRVQVEYIELSHELMTELMAVDVPLADNALRTKLGELMKAKKARLIQPPLRRSTHTLFRVECIRTFCRRVSP